MDDIRQSSARGRRGQEPLPLARLEDTATRLMHSADSGEAD